MRPHRPVPPRPRLRHAVLVAVATWSAGAPLTAAEDAADPDRTAPLPTAAPPPQTLGGGEESATADPGRARRAAIELALAEGLAFLAQVQSEGSDGSWPLREAKRANEAPLAVTALSTLALMAGGSPPGRGPHGAHVERAIDHLLARAALTEGDPERGYLGQAGDGNSRMHGHGFATLALAQAFASTTQSTRGRRLAEALPLAVQLIERTQGSEGGWNYEPRIEVEHEGSVTICLVQALRAARNAGIAVDAQVIARAEDYVRRSQAPDGSFRYTLGSDQTSVALTAAAIATLESVGRYDDPALLRGLEAIQRDLARREESGERSAFPYYERFYLALALWQHPDPVHFERWFEQELRAVLSAQEEDGSWAGSPYGRVYATAMNCLVLSMPLETLPIFAR